MASQHVVVYNTGSTPVVIDSKGHVLPAGEYRAVREGAQEVQTGIARGALIVVTDVPDDQQTDPGARAAAQAADEANGATTENQGA